jgi:lactoylglutathione lyase
MPLATARVVTTTAPTTAARARTARRMTTATRAASLSAYLPADTYHSLPKDGDVTFLHTMVRASNLEATMAFFSALGLVETRRKESQNGKFTLVFMASCQGAPEIEITYNWPDEATGETETFAPPSRSMGHLAFAVDDIYAKCEALEKAGIVINRPPRDGRMAFVISPDGISVELLQKGDALEPREPWKSMANIGSW